MGIPPDTDLSTPDARRDLTLTALCFVGPGLWFALLSVVYATSSHECGRPIAWLSIVLTGCGMLGALGAALGLLRLRHGVESVLPSLARYKAARLRLMLRAGLGLNLLSFVLLLGFLVPLLSLVPCE
jgi:hypothetical protein